jgi:hypothetical protein
MVRRAGFEPALFRSLRPGLCQLGYTSMVHREGFEPVTVLVLSQAPPANWATGAIDCQMEPPEGIAPKGEFCQLSFGKDGSRRPPQ